MALALRMCTRKSEARVCFARPMTCRAPIPGSHAAFSTNRGQAKIVRHGDCMLIVARHLKVFIVATALGGALDDVCIVVVHPIRAQHLGHGRRRQQQGM